MESWRDFGRFGEEKNLVPLQGLESWIVHHVTLSKYRLRNRGT